MVRVRAYAVGRDDNFSPTGIEATRAAGENCLAVVAIGRSAGYVEAVLAEVEHVPEQVARFGAGELCAGLPT